MGKELLCECGFRAGGPDTSEEELGDLAVVHVRRVHPDLWQQQGEQGIRQMTPALLRDFKP